MQRIRQFSRLSGRVAGLALLCALASVTAPPSALADGPGVSDPGSNYVPGPMPEACAGDPDGTVCENAAIYYLDQARASEGIPPYQLPADFVSLPADEQTLILTDLDRASFGLVPVSGITSTLDADSATGVQDDVDPTDSDSGIHEWGANWAGGYLNPPAAYEAWVYDDGPGSDNLDCQGTDTSGCWGHRHNILWDYATTSNPLALGAAAGTDPGGTAGYAMIIGQAETGYTPSYSYTWVEAQADGAGTNNYDPGVPPISESVYISLSGSGSVSDSNGQTCEGPGSCGIDETQGTAVTFTADPAVGQMFSAWGGACAGQKGTTCTITPEGSEEAVSVTFDALPSQTHGSGGGAASGEPGSGSTGSSTTTTGSATSTKVQGASTSTTATGGTHLTPPCLDRCVDAGHPVTLVVPARVPPGHHFTLWFGAYRRFTASILITAQSRRVLFRWTGNLAGGVWDFPLRYSRAASAHGLAVTVTLRIGSSSRVLHARIAP